MDSETPTTSSMLKRLCPFLSFLFVSSSIQPNMNSSHSSSSAPASLETSPHPTTTRVSHSPSSHNDNSLNMIDLGKLLLGFSVTIGVAIMVSASPLVKTVQMHIVVITLSLALACLWNGLLLRNTYPKIFTFTLLSGVSLIIISFYSLFACYLPIYLLWISLLCGLASLIPLAIYARTINYFPRETSSTTEDPEQGEFLFTGNATMP